MKTIQTDVLGYGVNVEVADSVEEFDKLAGREGACLDGANNDYIQHSWKTEVREKFVELIDSEHGFKRATKPGPVRKDGTPGPEVPAETYTTFLNRAKEQFDDEVLSDLMSRAAAAVPFDPSPSARTGGTGRLSKDLLAAADSIIEQGPDVVAGVVAKLEKLNDGLTIARQSDGSVTREALALALKINATRVTVELSKA